MFEKIEAGSISPYFKEPSAEILDKVLANGRTRREWAKETIRNEIARFIAFSLSQITREYMKIYVPAKDDDTYTDEERKFAEIESCKVQHYPIALQILKDIVKDM